MIRQGDVLIVPVEEIPATAEVVERENSCIILAHGEATGHAHKIKDQHAALFRDPKLMAVFLHVTGNGVAIEHDEHDTIIAPPGKHQVIRQREYSPGAIRNVTD